MDANTTVTKTEAPRRAWPVLLLALPAFVAIWSGWVELGRLTGFGPVSPLPGIWDELTIDTAITLPIGVETYAAYAMYVWLALDVSERAQRFARVSAIGSLVLGAGGQVAYHLMAAAGVIKAPWQITALVACLPVIVLGMGAALAHLVHETPAAEPTAEPVEHDQDDAEAWTERAVIVNALRDQHTDQPAPADTEPIAPAETATPIRSAEADQARRPTKGTRRAGASGNADKARKLRERYPDWTVARIAERVGVTERTARRYLNTAPADQTDQAPESADLAA
ncbi:hypothetical protein LWF15_09520 [Kineosporia rhizophila]|nr:hypothetical protein [Kineosporia rhizophila]MCE0535752.1 hypothetical protein [Kineosporia rhizophila]